MPLKTPSFWYPNDRKAGLAAYGLLPLAFLYQAGSRLDRWRRKPYRSSLPVICVGNLVAGGGGKTPTALALMTRIIEQRCANRPCFLTRGYGGAQKGPVLVNLARHDAMAVGDEAMLLARLAPTIVSSDRAAGARLAEASGFDLIVMDDGLQNHGLDKTLRVIVIDGASGFGNGRLLPAGPLRQPLRKGLAQADAFVLIGEDRSDTAARFPARPLLKATLRVSPDWHAPDARNLVAFAGLARPEKFRATLTSLGLPVTAWFPFPDHHVYTETDLQRLNAAARNHDAMLITTAKDAVKLPSDFPWHRSPVTLPVAVIWEDVAALDLILEKLAASS